MAACFPFCNQPTNDGVETDELDDMDDDDMRELEAAKQRARQRAVVYPAPRGGGGGGARPRVEPGRVRAPGGGARRAY